MEPFLPRPESSSSLGQTTHTVNVGVHVNMEPVVEHVEDGKRRAILGYTWPGIEEGDEPFPKYSFFEYVEAVRTSTIDEFKRVQEATEEWWSPTLDRGAGCALHFAVDAGRLDMVRYLLEEVKVPVNQQASLNCNWTPLHRCSRMVHYTHAPFMDIFEFLLGHGADPSLPDEQGLVPIELVVKQGYGWQEGEVRRRCEELVARYAHVEKAAPWAHVGGSVGEVADSVISAWRRLPPLYPFKNRHGGRARLS